MAFKKYESRVGAGRIDHLTRNRFALCWVGKTSITFNAAAFELFGDDTERLEIMWDAVDRRFAFIPAPVTSRVSLRLQSEGTRETSGVKRITTTGLFKEFPELLSLTGRTWRIMSDESNGYFEARFATQKELTDYVR